jgi:hypothetical protein
MPLRDYRQHRDRLAEQYRAAIEQKHAVREWLTEQTWTHFVTVAFNEQTTDASATRLLRRFHQRLDTKLFGRRFFKRPPESRTFFIAVPETASNLHYHMLFRVPPVVHDRFVTELPAILKCVAQAASYDIQPIPTDADRARIASYITKDAYQHRSIENFIVSSEFNRRCATSQPTSR